MLHWGSFYQNGTGNVLLSPTPTNLPGAVAEVATSNTSQYALLADGAVYAWGRGTHGQLGNGTTASSVSIPVKVDFPAGVVITKLPTDALPYDSALAIDSTGHIWGWGDNSAGELCLGNTSMVTNPVQLPFNDVTAAAGAGDHAWFVANGSLFVVRWQPGRRPRRWLDHPERHARGRLRYGGLASRGPGRFIP